MDQLARMGEWVVSAEPGAVLTCIGLGSCIGLAFVDRRAAVAGLAHVMLPSSPRSGDAPQPGKYADLAVPALLAAVLEHGAARHRLEAVLVGGAQMFRLGAGSGADIGARNEAAVRAELQRERVAVVAAATSGDKGRTVKVHVAGDVLAREAAGDTVRLLGADLELVA
jgi:chemotaxis protein CheD